MQSRYCDPGTGRFTTKDRFAGFEVRPASQNQYTYCENNPVNSVDPTGNFSKKHYRWGTLITFTSKERSAIVKILSGHAGAATVFGAYCGAIAAGAAVPTCGLSVATTGVISAYSYLAAAISGLGAWYFSYYSSVAVPRIM